MSNTSSSNSGNSTNTTSNSSNNSSSSSSNGSSNNKGASTGTAGGAGGANRNSPGCVVDACVYLHSRLAIRLRLEDGMRVTARELLALIIEEEEMNLPKQAMEVFAIWMVSPLLGKEIVNGYICYN